jgi:hypothetical protein
MISLTIVLLAAVAMAALAAMAWTGRIEWLVFWQVCWDMELSMQLLKFAPQIALSFRRRSTEGWSVYAVLWDLVGNFMNVVVLLFVAVDNESINFDANLQRALLAVVLTFLDLVMLFQHFFFVIEKQAPQEVWQYGIDSSLDPLLHEDAATDEECFVTTSGSLLQPTTISPPPSLQRSNSATSISSLQSSAAADPAGRTPARAGRLSLTPKVAVPFTPDQPEGTGRRGSNSSSLSRSTSQRIGAQGK